MGSLTAPPYDVIGGEQRLRLLAAHPHNVVRLILPGPAGRSEDGTFYTGAADLLTRWRKDGVLIQDPIPSFYPYRQTFTGPDGCLSARLGFLGALSLEEARAEGRVLPHENTLEAPRRDRTRLISACRANLSPVFLLHPDSGGAVGPILDRASRGVPLFRFTDEAGVLHELWSVAEPETVRSIGEGMSKDWTLIADGHHRYESALAVMQERPGEAGARQVLAFFCSLQDRGFRIFPIHRLVRGGRPEGSEGLRRLLEERLSHENLSPGLGPEGILARLSGSGGGTFAALLSDGPPMLLRPGNGMSAGALSPEEPDTLLLQREVLTRVLGITPQAVEAGAIAYTPDAGEALRQVQSGEAAAAFLMNPLQVESVVRAARAGLRLPQKSTYFYPKVFTGLAIRPF
jgi:uncharacterized protein (DUF1015 family)